MCGFAGVIVNSNQFTESSMEVMLSKIKHRGPDSQGIWHDNTVWLGHRRLSVVDLSKAGSQPMLSACGRYIIAFNGEIYNHLQIRKRLTEEYATQWRGTSDTEVMLELIALEGIDKALDEFDGMFSFSLWDSEQEIMYIARDRFGEKPVYYSQQGESFVFASELTSIEAYPSVNLSIDRGALCKYFQYSYFPAPLSIYNEVKKLEPAHYLIWQEGKVLDKICYWDIYEKAEYGRKNQFQGSKQEAIDCLDTLLTESVKKRMHADVPLGAFLSGGIDSSVVVGVMQKLANRMINTFTIGFQEQEFNEAKFAKQVSDHIGTNHTEKYMSGDDALSVVPDLADIYDEPFADPSQIPTFLVSQLAKEQVTVSLSGDGGDELFAGYSRYQDAQEIWRKISRYPYGLRRILAYIVNHIPVSMLNVVCAPLARWSMLNIQPGKIGFKIKSLSHWLEARSFEDIYKIFMTQWRNPNDLVIGAVDSSVWKPASPDFSNRVEKMAYDDINSYMAGDILTKVDRAAMSVSLESRIPLLDHKIAEFAFSLPIDFKWNGLNGKWVLRQVLYRYVPKDIVDRPKMGFGIPLSAWLKGELKDWAIHLLDQKKLEQQGYINVKLVKSAWNEHQDGEKDHSFRLWTVLMFQLWLEKRPFLTETT
ncbi:MAG: asparagine synthase (glutamine-hydrolyzing) [Pseudomonadales bacterium]|nr:asparagine synthase (glutamine-hydrolyzing) [Pseudomonadales bacterium]